MLDIVNNIPRSTESIVINPAIYMRINWRNKKMLIQPWRGKLYSDQLSLILYLLGIIRSFLFATLKLD